MKKDTQKTTQAEKTLTVEDLQKVAGGRPPLKWYKICDAGGCQEFLF